MFRIAPLALGIALVFSSQRSSAQQTDTAHTRAAIDSSLAAEAKIPLDSARAIALSRVPHGTVASEELERENGHLIYSFDVKVTGRTGIQEVNVNALTGKVLGVHHEGPATERKEARADSAAARKAGSSRASP